MEFLNGNSEENSQLWDFEHGHSEENSHLSAFHNGISNMGISKWKLRKKNSQIWKILDILRKESVQHLQTMQSQESPQLQPVQSQNLSQTFLAFLICPQFFSYFQSFQSPAL